MLLLDIIMEYPNFEEEEPDVVKNQEKIVGLAVSTLLLANVPLFYFCMNHLQGNNEAVVQECVDILRSQDYIMEPSIFPTLQRYAGTSHFCVYLLGLVQFPIALFCSHY